MQYSIYLVRRQALVAILITSFGILSLQAACDIFLPSSPTSIANSSILPQSTSRMPGDHTSTESSIQHDAVLAAISDLSNSLSQMNASLASLHATLAHGSDPDLINDPETKDNLRAAQKRRCPKPRNEMSAQDSLVLCSCFSVVAFLFGVVIFLEDASHVSRSFVTICWLVMIAMANIGPATVVSRAGHSRWDTYMCETAWPVALSMAGLTLYEVGCRRIQSVAEDKKVVKGG